MLFRTRVAVRDLRARQDITPNPALTRDSGGRITVVLSTYVSVIVTDTISRDPNGGLALGLNRAIVDAP